MQDKQKEDKIEFFFKRKNKFKEIKRENRIQIQRVLFDELDENYEKSSKTKLWVSIIITIFTFLIGSIGEGLFQRLISQNIDNIKPLVVKGGIILSAILGLIILFWIIQLIVEKRRKKLESFNKIKIKYSDIYILALNKSNLNPNNSK